MYTFNEQCDSKRVYYFFLRNGRRSCRQVLRSIQGIHQLFGSSVAYSSVQMPLATSGDNGARSSNLLSWEKGGNVVHSGLDHTGPKQLVNALYGTQYLALLMLNDKVKSVELVHTS